MARPRKQTYTLDMYLKKNMKGNIDNKADVQRDFAWNNEQINELVATVLTDDYIPPIILGEESNSKLHIVDGGCRTAALIKFRYGNHKITSAIENPLVPYKKKVIDENGNETYEEAIFNIKNKTYDKLPEELKEKFDEYQIETVIHESCDSFIISKYIKRYNNHVSMNTDQRAFTYMDKFASRIRKIMDSKFFIECNTCSEIDKKKGVIERIIIESLMCMNHFDNWKSQPKPAFKYLNNNATEEEFDYLADNLERLGEIITTDIKDIFNKKDSFIFLTLFDKFVKLGFDDIQFADFLRKFKNELRLSVKNIKGLLFDEIDKGSSTKDKQVVGDKLEMLENLMLEFLHINKEELETPICLEKFIADNLDVDVETIRADLDFYNEDFDDVLENTVVFDSKLRQEQNRPSLIAMRVYSYKKDMDIDFENWLKEYACKNNSYISYQKNNFLHMKADFEQYCKEHKLTA